MIYNHEFELINRATAASSLLLIIFSRRTRFGSFPFTAEVILLLLSFRNVSPREVEFLRDLVALRAILVVENSSLAFVIAIRDVRFSRSLDGYELRVRETRRCGFRASVT